MSDKPEIRCFSLDQANAVAALHARCFDRSWSLVDFQRYAQLDAYTGVTAWAKGQFAGFALASRSADEAEILTLAMAPECRCKGIARLMLPSLLSRLEEQGAGSVFLEVGETNLPAIALYRSCAFEMVGTRPGYYSTANGQEDALIMRFIASQQNRL